jgi:WD40 repeat protein
MHYAVSMAVPTSYASLLMHTQPSPVQQLTQQRLPRAQLRTVHHSAVTALDWSYDNSYLVSCSGEQHVALWHVPSRSCRRVLVMADGQQAHSCRWARRLLAPGTIAADAV